MRQTESNKAGLVVGILALVAILAAVGIFMFMRGRTNSELAQNNGINVVSNISVDTRATSETNQVIEDSLGNRQVFFAGIEDLDISMTTSVLLENLPENEDILMKYEIYNSETEDLIFETDLIPSGEHVEWVPGRNLDKGEYQITMVETPYYPNGDDTYMPLTVGSNVLSLVLHD